LIKEIGGAKKREKIDSISRWLKASNVQQAAESKIKFII